MRDLEELISIRHIELEDREERFKLVNSEAVDEAIQQEMQQARLI